MRLHCVSVYLFPTKKVKPAKLICLLIHSVILLRIAGITRISCELFRSFFLETFLATAKTWVRELAVKKKRIGSES